MQTDWLVDAQGFVGTTCHQGYKKCTKIPCKIENLLDIIKAS